MRILSTIKSRNIFFFVFLLYSHIIDKKYPDKPCFDRAIYALFIKKYEIKKRGFQNQNLKIRANFLSAIFKCF